MLTRIEYSWELALISIAFYVIMFAIAKPTLTYRNPQYNNVRGQPVFFFTIFALSCIFAFWSGDTFHYWDAFLSAYSSSDYSFEPFYVWLADLSGNDYFVWRTLIFLPTSYILYLISKTTNTLNRNLLVSLLLFGGMLSFTRGMLGHTLLLLGVSMLVDENKSNRFRLLGLIIFCLSYFVHKSMYINMLFAVIALLPFSKFSIKTSFILFPFFTTIATAIVNNVATGLWVLDFYDESASYGDRALYYATMERSEKGVNAIVGDFIRISPQYVALFYVTNRVVFKNYFKGIRQEQLYTYLFKLTYVSIYIGSLFYFTQGSGSIYVRFKYMGLFPLIFVLAKVLSMEPSSNKWVRWIIVTQIFSILFTLCYTIYDWYRL